MKILVIKRTTENDWKNDQIDCEESRNIKQYWNEYKNENQVPFDLEFEFVKGNRLWSVDGWTPEWGYYYDKQTLLQTIETQLQEKSIDGILIDPILTEEEEMDYKSCNVVRCDTAEEIYATFARKVPIAISVPMECSPLFEQTNLYREIARNMILNNRTTIPVFHLTKFSIFYTPMFRYFIEAELKRDALEDRKQKKIEKV